jgi:hypothetical protein
MRLGLGLGLSRGAAVGGAPLPAPTTTNFTYAETVSGWGGTLSTTKNAARLYGIANSSIRATFWAGYITGTHAYIFATSDFGANPGLIDVSIDGGLTFTVAPNVSTKYTLFAGLPHASRFVVIRFGGSFGTAPYILNTGTIFEVTGQPPAMAPIVGWRVPFDTNTDKIESNQSEANQASYVPTLRPSLPSGTNPPSIMFKATTDSLYIATYSPTVFVSIDGAAPTKYTRTAGQGVLVTGLSGEHTYNIWSTSPQVLYVGIGSGSFSALTPLRRLDQFGDSITAGGASGTVAGDVETFAVAAALGYVGGTSGLGGNTIATLGTRLTGVLAAKTVTGSDVAILAIGRNDIATASATRQSGYVSLINALITKGYGKIICRSVLRSDNGTSYTAVNDDIIAAIATVGDPKAVYLDIEGWFPVSQPDDTHPDVAGYEQMRVYGIADYPAVLP